MRTAVFALTLVLTACTEGTLLPAGHRPALDPGDVIVDTDTDTDTTTWDTDTTDTDTDVPVVVTLDADCLPDPTHALRFICNVSVDPPGAVDVEFFKVDGTGPVRVHSGEDVLADHEVWLYLMEELTDYVWRATPRLDPDVVVQDVVTTGAVPDGAQVVSSMIGVSSAPMFLLNSPCSAGGYALIVDGEGTVLWYHNFEQPTGASIVDGVNFTEDGTVMAMMDDHVIEVDLTGRELFHTERNVDYFNNVHHDMFKKDGLTYIIYNETIPYHGDNFVMDGFYVFDGNGVMIQNWRLFDYFQPTRPALGQFGAEDYTHANAVWVDDNGDILFNMRHLSAFAKISGDPYDPAFGEILWRISGDPNETDFGMDFTLTNTAGGFSNFRQQHNVHVLPDGRLALFDNRMSALETSRLLVLSVDEVAMTLNIDEAYDTFVHCAFQGGAWHTPAGNPVATCAPRGVAYEYSPGVYDQTVFELEISCVTGFDNYIPRYSPIDI